MTANDDRRAGREVDAIEVLSGAFNIPREVFAQCRRKGIEVDPSGAARVRLA